MTKDRRLGRGLAALLGTPLEEDGILDSPPTPKSVSPTAASMSSSSSPTATSSTLGGSSTKIAGMGSSPPRSAFGSSQRGESGTELRIHAPTDGASGVQSAGKSGVTGSVSLSGRTAKRPAEVSNSAASELGADADSGDAQPAKTQTLEIPVANIQNNPFQPRRRFNEQEIASLAASICEHQQLQPILVRRVGRGYQLISGERRLRATIHAGLTTIRAEVREADDRLVAELAIVENLQRKDLDAIEKAMSFRRYIDEHKCTQEDLARRLKIDRSTIANLMRLLELPAEIQAWVQNEKITAGHARTLLTLSTEALQLEFAQRIMDESWTVRDTEAQVNEQMAIEDGRKLIGTVSKRGSRKRSTPQLASLEQKMRLSLGTKTEVRQGATGGGKIVISFANADEFERLCALICPQLDVKVA